MQESSINTSISILLVEDNLLVATTIRELLLDVGYQVNIAESGKSAEDILKKGLSHIVILDRKLPDTDGITLLKKWRKTHPDLVIIIMTAYSDVDSAVTCLKEGAYDFLPKPVDQALLLKAIGNAIDHFKLTWKVNVLTELS